MAFAFKSGITSCELEGESSPQYLRLIPRRHADLQAIPSEVFRNCLNVGDKGDDANPTLRLVENSGIVRTILDVLLLPIDKIATTPQYWTFEEARTEYAAAEKYMLDRYMSIFDRRVERAVEVGPFEALVWAVTKGHARIARVAIEQFANQTFLRLGSDHTDVKPGYWTTAMIVAIGVQHYRQLVRLSMECITKSRETGRLRIDWVVVGERFEIDQAHYVAVDITSDAEDKGVLDD